jgi:hypothetical protein
VTVARKIAVVGTRLVSPGKLMALFVVLSGIPLIALSWLGWRLLQQDMALDAQRLRERLESAATVLGREFERELVVLRARVPVERSAGRASRARREE